MVTSDIAASTACDVSCRAARLTWRGDIVLDDVSVREPGVSGPGAEFFSAERIFVRAGWGEIISLALGRPFDIRSLRFETPVARFSHASADGALNVSGLLARGGSIAGAAPAALPEIEVLDGLITYGEHNDKEHIPLLEVRLAGRLRAPDSGRPLYLLEMQELAESASSPMRIEGGIDLEVGAAWMDLNDVDLSRLRISAPTRGGGDIWRQLDIAGGVPLATLRYTQEHGAEARFALHDVSLTMPIPSETPEDAGGQADLMRMRSVDGEITFSARGLEAELDGLVEDLPAHVSLTTSGLATDAALRCELSTQRFVVSSRPRLLPFAPHNVREVFREFGGPTAEVSGRVTIERGEPVAGVPAPISASGEFALVNGTLAHEDFPYRIFDLAGSITFDDERLVVEGLEGVGATGVRARAWGWAALGRKPLLEIHIESEAAAVDEELERALPPEWRPIISEICSRSEHARLLDQGIILTTAERDLAEERLQSLRQSLRTHHERGGSAAERVALERSIQAIEASLLTPIFDLAGAAAVHVLVSRTVQGERTQVTVDARFDSLGILLDSFPYPVRAEDLRLTVQPGAVKAVTERLAGLTGAGGRLELEWKVDPREAGRGRPDVHVVLDGAPIDPLLLAALPDSENDDDVSLRRFLTSLGLTGHVGANVGIFPEDDGEIGFRVDALLGDCSVRPAAPADSGDSSPRIHALSGPITVTRAGADIGPILGRLESGGDVRIEARTTFAGDNPDAASRLEGSVNFVALDLSHAIERLIAPASPELAAQLEETRRTWSFSGAVDALARFAQVGDGPLEGSATLSNFNAVSFDGPAGRWGVSRSAGLVQMSRDTIHFADFHADVDVAGAPAARLGLEGSLGVEPGASTKLAVIAEGARFESPLTRALIEMAGGPRAASAFDQRRPSGLFDAQAELARTPNQPMQIHGSVSPRTLTLSPTSSDSAETVLFELSGAVSFSPEGGRVEALSAAATDWSATINGDWRLGPDPGADLRLDVEGGRLPDDLIALLPEGARSAIREIDLAIDDGFSVENAALRVFPSAAHAESAPANGLDASFSGEIRFSGARCIVGVPISEADGAAVIEATDQGGAVALSLRDFRASGLRASNARGKIAWRERDDGRTLLDVTDLSGDCHGGRITASARVEENHRGRLEYRAMLRASGVDPLRGIADLTGVAPEGDDDTARLGRLDGAFSLSGVVGDETSLIGRGLIHVDGGKLVRLPLLLPILELSSLQAPLSESLTEARADFYLEGRRIVFDELWARSRSILVAGQGQATLPDLALDLRFTSRGEMMRLPFISDLVDAVKNELVSVRVGGTLRSPTFGAEALPATSELVRSLLEAPESRRVEATAPVESRESTHP